MGASSFIQIPEPVDPHLRRWMMFVDGENLAIRAQQFAAKQSGLKLTEGTHYLKDVFVWLPGLSATDAFLNLPGVRIQRHAIRSYYYTSVVGDAVRIQSVKAALWDLGFHPEVFKKTRKEDKAKGVDISLAKDLLSHAFLNNLDVAVLVAGDGDYAPLVEAVERLGKVVYGVFFSEGLSPELKFAADKFVDSEWDSFFSARWGGLSNSGRTT